MARLAPLIVVGVLSVAGTAWAGVSASTAPVRDLAVRSSGNVVFAEWTPTPSAASSVFNVSTEARTGNGSGAPVVNMTLSPSATSAATPVVSGARYLVRLISQGPGGSAEATGSAVVSVRTKLSVSAASRVKYRRVITLRGLMVSGGASFPPRGKVRVYRYWWNAKARRWALKSYVNKTIDVGARVGSASTFRYRYKPPLKGYWVFAVRPRYHEGFRPSKRWVYSRYVRVY